MDYKNVKYLVIPDVHGRTFWEEPVKEYLENCPDTKIIFLGDYLDPYQYEGITPDDSIVVFERILELKHQNPDRITLLLGNHDLHYVVNDKYGCRMDHKNKKKIVDIFGKEIDNFDLCKFDSINNKNIIFSHAGFTRGWVFNRMDKIYPNYEDIEPGERYYEIEYSTLKDIDWKKVLNETRVLSDVSFYRGGMDPFSSFLWTDISEMILAKDPLNAVQIFGHSQQVKDPVKYKNFYCLDCRKPFVVTDDADVRNMDFSEIPDRTQVIDDEIKRKMENMSVFMQ